MTDVSIAPDGTHRLDPRTRRMVVVLLFGAVLPLLDITIVNVALDNLSKAFDAPVSAVQWVATGYALASAVAIPVSGWATHRFGGKQVWITALALFLAGSVACGLAWNLASLIAFRIVQGIGGGLSMPVLQTLLVRSADKQQATRAMGAVGSPAVLAPILGPILGGLLLGWADWRWIFLVNVPVCIVGIIMAARHLPISGRTSAHTLDLPGLLMLSPGLALLVFGLSQTGSEASGPRWAVTVSVGSGAALLIAFALWALRTPAPLLDVRLFKSPHFLGAWITLLMTCLVFYGGLLLLPLYYQRTWGCSPLQAGLILAVQGVGALAARSVANRLTTRIGTRATVLTALALGVVGTVPFAAGPASGLSWLLYTGLVIRGAGIGAVTILIMGACYHRIGRDHIAYASAASRIATQLGGALGSVLVVAALSTQTTISSAAAPEAFATSFWWLTGISAIAVLPALLLPRGPVERL
ncbi:DHA2 family efflux MFS transporter permease subunit [Streptomyces sioyaensis]|uniref:DHA2 family efflux MFS transporter permease subunit n=1 Tax=Streptomyces sioyaensis TaxID=67364 RepID=UPI0037CFDBD8